MRRMLQFSRQVVPCFLSCAARICRSAAMPRCCSSEGTTGSWPSSRTNADSNRDRRLTLALLRSVASMRISAGASEGRLSSSGETSGSGWMETLFVERGSVSGRRACSKMPITELQNCGCTNSRPCRFVLSGEGSCESGIWQAVKASSQSFISWRDCCVMPPRSSPGFPCTATSIVFRKPLCTSSVPSAPMSMPKPGQPCPSMQPSFRRCLTRAK
mmetsp:Transcript_16698/g.37621  ORF Transcript_16698/g.37621 Transcript_16698/m.37621 type:complete len:215 (-) Transcript_16698:978-1622(-)